MKTFLTSVVCSMAIATSAVATELTVATFNVSMEAENYVERGEGDTQVLIERLASGDEPQIRNIARIIQTVRPDIILLNEFDYIENEDEGVAAFVRNYLNVSQGGAEAIDYEHYFYAPVNTGRPSAYDLDRDGKASGKAGDAWGFGMYPGQYGMVILSRYPIERDAVRTFLDFKWKDMPQHLQISDEDGNPWYAADAWSEFPLSSKSHWDVPVNVEGTQVHVLASHPTPPVFDGPENRNGIRNHDEIRFWADYIEGRDYFYDDSGERGGLEEGAPFFILGDLNASPDEGDAIAAGIRHLLSRDQVQGEIVPMSVGGAEHAPDNPNAASHTAGWGMRADYALASRNGVRVDNSGVFWPAADEDDYELVASRAASSDHRLVWLRVTLRAD
jgi:endonuclease/exonuclease/phosphatase family metal-dependent hydrolase